MVNSIDYYDNNAEAFFSRTINIDLSMTYDKFLRQLPTKAKILDAGCGVGRDSKYFKNLGHKITAFDGSMEMVRLSTKTLEQQTLHLFFQEITFKEEFDAIWANASLLHVPYEGLKDVILRLHNALKTLGVFFASFKYGEKQRVIEGRAFYDMNEETIQPYLEGLFTTIEIWQTPDNTSKVAPSPSKAWLNILGRKI